MVIRGAREDVVGHGLVRYIVGAALLVACGGPAKKPAAPLSNAETGSASASGEGGAGEGRVIQRTQMGGVIELSGDRGAAMKQADEEMAAHCGPNNYTIVQEGEEAILTDTYDPSIPSTQSQRTSTAWRVHYQCNGTVTNPP